MNRRECETSLKPGNCEDNINNYYTQKINMKKLLKVTDLNIDNQLYLPKITINKNQHQ